MKKITFILILLTTIALSATPTYYPLTSIAEGFFASWCVTCHDGLAGLNLLDAAHHNGELINARYYTTSGELSSPNVEARLTHYEVYGVPVMIMNGKLRIDGGGPEITDGSAYAAAYNQFKFGAAPIKMNVSGWQADIGRMTGEIEMISPTYQIENQKKYYLLIESNATPEATNVVRDIAYETFSLSGQGNVETFDHTFTINPAWNQANLWVAAFVQLQDDAIIQACSSLPMPDINLRAAMDWVPNVRVPANSTWASNPFWFFNMGIGGEYTMQIVVDSAPPNWYFNYCDEDGLCLPGSIPMPLTMAAGSLKGFHLNILSGDSGIANIRFRISSNQLGNYDVPFRLVTDDLSVDDNISVLQGVKLGANYPNPFHKNTNFTVETEKNISNLLIDFYNVRGQLVDTISQHTVNSGVTSIEWDAPEHLNSGIYYYNVRGNQATRQKLVILK